MSDQRLRDLDRWENEGGRVREHAYTRDVVIHNHPNDGRACGCRPVVIEPLERYAVTLGSPLDLAGFSPRLNGILIRKPRDP